MKKRHLLFSLTAIFFVFSCGKMSTTSQQPNPSPQAETPKPHAYFKVLAQERQFTETQLVSCLLDANRGEAVITFKDVEKGTLLSIRSQGVGATGSSVDMKYGDSKSLLFINLGGDDDTSFYRLNHALSVCKVSIQINQSNMFGTFQCENLMNEQGGLVTGNGQWLCAIQPQKEWNW